LWYVCGMFRIALLSGTGVPQLEQSLCFGLSGQEFWVYLTFRGLCIVIYSYNKTNEMHYSLKFIFEIELDMFRTVSLSTIRSLALYTQQ
jgi:hypothetical protein